MPEVSPNFKSSEYCKTCGKIVWVGENSTSCSPNCRSMIFRKRIILNCDGCLKKFSIMPCYKRNANYCSLDCYWNTTRKKEKRFCKVCGKEFWATKPLISKGFGIFCSRECQHKTYPPKVVIFCKQCNKRVEIWPSKIHLIKFCSRKCADDFVRDYVDLVCKFCKKTFQTPRWEVNRGRGTFCSRECFIQYKGESSLEEKMRFLLTKSKIKFSQEYKFGRYRADFLLPDLKIVVECDGEFWHMNPKAKSRDAKKDEYLIKQGYKVIRISGTNINNYSDKELIKRILF